MVLDEKYFSCVFSLGSPQSPLLSGLLKKTCAHASLTLSINIQMYMYIYIEREGEHNVSYTTKNNYIL